MEHTTSTHRSHDESLVVRLFGGDVSAIERERALSLVADCGSCAALFADLGAIATATAALPVPPRPRDFTLCAEDAELLRPTPRRGLAKILGLGRVRSLGGSLVALGIAGFVLIGSTSALPQLTFSTFDNHAASLTTTDTSERGAPGVTEAPFVAGPVDGPTTGSNVPAAVDGAGKGIESPAATSIFGVAGSGTGSVVAVATPAPNVVSIGSVPPAVQGPVTGPVSTVPTSSGPPLDLRLPAAVGSALLVLLGLFLLIRPRRSSPRA